MVRKRNPQGGPRQGQPGKAYPNRTDLNAAPRPPQVATGQPYGEAGAQAASLATVPLPAHGAPAPAPAAGGDPHAAAAGFQMPAFGAFDRPTERPDEPLTHGAPVGLGAGPEVMPGVGGAPSGMAGLLRSIAGAVGSSDLEELALRAESLGH